MRKRGQQRRTRRGYSFIELAIVTLIMGILASVAAPRYIDSMARYRVDAAANRIAADLRMACQYARRTSLAQSVAFDASNDRYAAPGLPDVDRPNAAYSVDLTRTQYAADMSSADFSGSPTITFDIYGRPDRTGSVVVQSRGKQRTVSVDEVGTVTIQ